MTAADLGPHVMVLLAAAATYLWRGLGVAVATRVDDGSPAFRFVKAVATALIAGLVARLVLFPAGALAATPLELRLGAMAAGALAYAVAGRSVLLGIVACEAVLIGGVWWLAQP